MASGWYILAKLRYAILISINEAVRSTLSTSHRLAECTDADEEYGLASVAVAAYALIDRLEEVNLVPTRNREVRRWGDSELKTLRKEI